MVPWLKVFHLTTLQDSDSLSLRNIFHAEETDGKSATLRCASWVKVCGLKANTARGFTKPRAQP